MPRIQCIRKPNIEIRQETTLPQSTKTEKKRKNEKSKFTAFSKMLSPNPLSLLCALLLCLPLAIVYTTTKHTTSTDTPIILNTPINNISISEKFNQKLSLSPTSMPTRSMRPSLLLPYLYTDYDDELLKAATRVAERPTRPQKTAFMFITTAPLPFAPLWELYFNQTSKNLYNIYIHADPTFSYDPPFSEVFHDRVIPSKPTRRHTPTLAAAARRLLAHALLHDPSNSVFVLLSPSCIPLHSLNFTIHALHSRGKSFLEILVNEPTQYDRWAARGPHAMLPEIKFNQFRVGSQFWALTRRHARMVVSERVLWRKFNVPCELWYACYPEENYFPTLLNMWDPRGCVHATLTHVNWTGRWDGHPRTYEAWEVGPELIRRMRRETPKYGDGGDGRRDPFLFARKFAPDALRPLMRIANDVIFRD
ncbi:hypothetical protein Fmac_031951 [Flemingia macrophylla]|uniref:Core-2/I-branching beta-1,6-N-acetylglucosaminyltransferase family protein n=1 Tax=Flemingia macrophylla TaxID=520843 RepID=A0ABD1L3I6_9FABA